MEFQWNGTEVTVIQNTAILKQNFTELLAQFTLRAFPIFREIELNELNLLSDWALLALFAKKQMGSFSRLSKNWVHSAPNWKNGDHN